MGVERIEAVSPEVLEAVNEMIPQLSRSTGALRMEDLEKVVHQEGVYLFGYRTEEGTLVGMLTLATFVIPTGVRAWIEDVVVLESARGQGAGQQLVEAAVAWAAEIGARTVDLTSRPSREAANRLYVRCGFHTRETNVYRYQPERA
ncbi:MAG: GNAT family N-acetyltransferase [Bowdeniella nasicola]|nr:GNAT family N-acetyltransferase [Bowdeniella nasicola]